MRPRYQSSATASRRAASPRTTSTGNTAVDDELLSSVPAPLEEVEVLVDVKVVVAEAVVEATDVVVEATDVEVEVAVGEVVVVEVTDVAVAEVVVADVEEAAKPMVELVSVAPAHGTGAIFLGSRRQGS